MRPDSGPSTSPSVSLPMGWLTLGLLVGVVYSVFDTAMDTSLLEGSSLLAFSALHRFANTIAPPVAGMVVGLLFAYMRQRDALIAAERRSAHVLRERLKGVERQQAVWLLASSLLHDIRNPLHALGLLLDEAAQRAGNSGAGLDPLLAKTRAQADRIEQRIASLRDLAESPPRVRSIVHLDNLVRAVADDVRDVAERKHVVLRVGALVHCELQADERYLRTPLENLVMNAIDAASGGPEPAVVSIEIERGADNVSVLISDTGPGVPLEARTGLFEPLRSGKALGLGLGLPLARALARLENGDVRLLGSGPPTTTFALVLPTLEPTNPDA
jgi:two-component system, LuxR family, sensor kinase FixL